MESQQYDSENMAINEIQLILAEKRTSLSVMRTGIAVLALPISVLSVLIAMSKYYDFIQVLYYLIPLSILLLLLTALGSYLIIRSIVRMKHYDQFIRQIKMSHLNIEKFIE
ncbi:MAG: hypothetical protein MUP22_12510 [Desulfobacterales bacterium]|nr:hypothetical protein [Desulfobacterales bacterium]